MKLRHAVVVAVGIGIGAAGVALATHGHPVRATHALVWFVPAYQPCVSPTPGLVHGPTFGSPGGDACPPALGSGMTFGPEGAGWVKMTLLSAFYVPANDNVASDIQFEAKLSDVRQGGVPFDGNLLVVGVARYTDHDCVPSGSCTMTDIPFPVPLPCGTTAPGKVRSGTCRVKTTYNTIVGGAVAPGTEANVGISQLQVYSGVDLVFEGGLSFP